MESRNGSKRWTTSIHPRVIAVVMSLFATVGPGVGCGVDSKLIKPSQELGKPKETPVPLVSSEANQGKRCEARVYSDVGADEDYNPFCYEVQRRLVKAAHEGDLDAIRAALSEGANVDGSVYWFYYPPLVTAAGAGRTDVVRLLLDNGSNVNQGDFIHGTPLTVAAGNGHAEVVKLLMQRGADVCLKVDGGTAVEIAQNEGHKEIVNLLKTEAEKCK